MKRDNPYSRFFDNLSEGEQYTILWMATSQLRSWSTIANVMGKGNIFELAGIEEEVPLIEKLNLNRTAKSLESLFNKLHGFMKNKY